jgi:hypothetical protein
MARLTEQEKQDIIRYLEADKPLPDLPVCNAPTFSQVSQEVKR